MGHLLPGECRGHPRPECSLPGAAQGLGETLLPEYNTGLRKGRGFVTHMLLHRPMSGEGTDCALFLSGKITSKSVVLVIELFFSDTFLCALETSMKLRLD